jgi:hypothetical protein
MLVAQLGIEPAETVDRQDLRLAGPGAFRAAMIAYLPFVVNLTVSFNMISNDTIPEAASSRSLVAWRRPWHWPPSSGAPKSCLWKGFPSNRPLHDARWCAHPRADIRTHMIPGTSPALAHTGPDVTSLLRLVRYALRSQAMSPTRYRFASSRYEASSPRARGRGTACRGGNVQCRPQHRARSAGSHQARLMRMLPPGYSPVSCELAGVPKHAVAKMDGKRNLDLGGEMLPYTTIPATISSPLSSLSTH